jgi:hypothetical protein
MSETEYAKSNNGLVHVVNPIGGEHTLCGDAFDIDALATIGRKSLGEEDAKLLGWDYVKHGPVTCENCARVIRICRGVRLEVKP